MALMNFVAVCYIFFTGSIIATGKQRNWLGPVQFSEGTAPSPRNSLGFASNEDGLFVFGGYDQNGANYALRFLMKLKSKIKFENHFMLLMIAGAVTSDF
jgi:hypothetical protein